MTALAHMNSVKKIATANVQSVSVEVCRHLVLFSVSSCRVEYLRESLIATEVVKVQSSTSSNRK